MRALFAVTALLAASPSGDWHQALVARLKTVGPNGSALACVAIEQDGLYRLESKPPQKPGPAYEKAKECVALHERLRKQGQELLKRCSGNSASASAAAPAPTGPATAMKAPPPPKVTRAMKASTSSKKARSKPAVEKPKPAPAGCQHEVEAWLREVDKADALVTEVEKLNAAAERAKAPPAAAPK